MKKIILILLFAVNVAVFGQSSKWSLQDCIDYAIQNNITIKSEQHHHKKSWNQQKDLGTESSAIEIQQTPFCKRKHEFEFAEWFQCGSGDQYF